MANYRNAKILKSARGEECTLNSSFCNYNAETTVFCHLNESFAGKGTGIKAHDYAGFYGCSSCHEAYDRGKLDDVYYYLTRALLRTIGRLIEKGIL